MRKTLIYALIKELTKPKNRCAEEIFDQIFFILLITLSTPFAISVQLL